MDDEEALPQIAARLVEGGLPQGATAQALRDVRRLCRRLQRAYVQEEMGEAPMGREAIQHLRRFDAPIVARCAVPPHGSGSSQALDDLTRIRTTQ